MRCPVRGVWSAVGLCLLLGGCDVRLDLGDLDRPIPRDGEQPTCITPSADRLDFGRVDDDRVVVRRVTLTNTCMTDAWVENIHIEGASEFSLLPASRAASDDPAEGGAALGWAGPSWSGDVLGPGMSTPVAIAFRGSWEAAWTNGRMVVDSASADGTGQAHVSLEANRYSTCLDVRLLDAAELDYGCQPVGVARSAALEVVSCSGVPVVLSPPTVTGSPNFEVTGFSDSKTLQPGESTTFRLVYSSALESAVSPVINWDEGNLSIAAENPETAERTTWTRVARGFARYGTCTGLEVELRWHTPGDPDPSDSGPEAGADLDLHLMHPMSLGWYRYPFDAFWINREPNWGDFGSARDDPRMDSDSIDGTSAERITMELPEDGLSYRVGVHCWNAHGLGASDATVVVRYFGKEVFRQTQALADLDLWEVGSISWPGGLLTPTAERSSDAVLPAWNAPCDRAGCKSK